MAQTLEEAEAAVTDMLSGNAFGEAGCRVVIEEFLSGEEAKLVCEKGGEFLARLAYRLSNPIVDSFVLAYGDQCRPKALAKNTAISTRVRVLSGQKLTPPQPAVMPEAASASTCLKPKDPTGTSAKVAVAGAGLIWRVHRTIMPRNFRSSVSVGCISSQNTYDWVVLAAPM